MAQAGVMMPLYCVDSSSLIEAWTRSYPLDLFPTFWDRIGALAADGTLLCPDEVLRELAGKDDGLRAWAKGNIGFVHPLDAEQWEEAKKITNKFPLLVKQRTGKSRGDPFVIGLARLTGRCVITEETPSAAPHRDTKIPDVCNHFEMRWINLLAFIREQRWTF